MTIAAGLTPAAQIAAQPGRYPPALTGLRGQHDGSFEVAHALAREGRQFPVDGTPIEESYDLVVVGGGISGLAAAWFYRRATAARAHPHPRQSRRFRRPRQAQRVHARRPPHHRLWRQPVAAIAEALYSPVAKGLLRDLGVDIARFETAFERKLYPSLGLSRGVFFDREAFGRDALVTGDPPSRDADETARRLRNARPLAEFVAGFPDLGGEQGAD